MNSVLGKGPSLLVHSISTFEYLDKTEIDLRVFIQVFLRKRKQIKGNHILLG